MRFKVEILMPSSGVIVTDRIDAKDLSELEFLIKKLYPKGKVLSIIGGE